MSVCLKNRSSGFEDIYALMFTMPKRITQLFINKMATPDVAHISNRKICSFKREILTHLSQMKLEVIVLVMNPFTCRTYNSQTYVVIWLFLRCRRKGDRSHFSDRCRFLVFQSKNFCEYVNGGSCHSTVCGHTRSLNSTLKGIHCMCICKKGDVKYEGYSLFSMGLVLEDCNPSSLGG